MRRAVGFIALALAAARPASAGLECESPTAMKAVEDAAASRIKGTAPSDPYAYLCVQLDARALKPRIERACTRILDRDGEGPTGEWIANECVVTAAAAGITTLGAHDIFALVGAMAEDPIEFADAFGLTKIGLYGAMGDVRGAQIVADEWRAAIPRAEQRERRHGSMANWSSWRQRAARTLAAIGRPEDADFLDEQAKATVDTHVADECRAAASTIRARVAAAGSH